jgi:hypothetical protein
MEAESDYDQRVFHYFFDFWASRSQKLPSSLKNEPQGSQKWAPDSKSEPQDPQNDPPGLKNWPQDHKNEPQSSKSEPQDPTIPQSIDYSIQVSPILRTRSVRDF